MGWAILSIFHQRRPVREAFKPPARGGGTVFQAIAAKSLLVPALTYLMVHLATAATAMPFTPAVPPPA